MAVKRNGGFTIVELIMVIVILGILAVTAIAKYQDMQSKAATATADGIAGAVTAGALAIKLNGYANGQATPAYPTTLDGQNTGAACSNCFVDVLDSPISASGWSKTSSTVYTYARGATTCTLTYTTSNGVVARSGC